MRHIIRFIAVAIIFCSSAILRAQSTNTNTVPITNAVLTATMNLTGYIQQPTNAGSVLDTVAIQKFATKDIVAAIAADLGVATDLSTAKLLLVFSGVGRTNENANLGVVLRTSGGDISVTNTIFLLQFPSRLSLLNNVTVTTERPNPNGTSTRADYSIMSVSLTTTNLSFQTQGQVKITQSSITSGRTILDPRAFPTAYNCTVTGSGKVGTNSAVFSGTFAVANRKIEAPAP